ncbi:bifunctional 2-keto-4-hydroxyglutarate aldolase/2-keto-3-deoxy-6-phosphogluconate aldolase [Chengkuizengella axinellae]|uniref:Bifunctional 2-keto-4-hydroxyglutarate aldolase/2-keto-3-deoxy-6-phosphogluconate aldolase n=1 Tax=Chengkuizengella axinellae TaxID=3064388 RepID=A0ABT9ITD5_9BACL|nr:bifunctional 2-keto-4-hydroxyglutarate aldolase/2-keto-3-deoxy-6-phosphogluconate aldolase [Chengkuizengella sp. 2205SS18-9]MDP5272620.1 bifunctional 2-keto-4-hydroxyglutarate aldolase/2-keto-3-deoxy-6-phosphogluconate aldolase [Chengkuizengella sp. 2205SS18-9]
MKKYETLKKMNQYGVVAVLRGKSAEDVLKMSEAAIAGGIKSIEVTMTAPGALDIIEELSNKYSQNANPESPVIGAGTVLDDVTARLAILKGASYVVSPSFQPETATMCNRYRIPYLPGVMTVREAQTAIEAGADIVKLFPGNVYSPSTISALKGPLPQLNIMPTGGVNIKNLHEWIQAGAFAVGIGSDLTKEAEKTGDISIVTQKAEDYMEAFYRAKQ